jgi:hypothetical protein
MTTGAVEVGADATGSFRREAEKSGGIRHALSAKTCSLTTPLSKLESPRRNLARCRTGETHEVELAKELPVGSRVDLDCDARQRKKLQSQCAMATGSNGGLAALFLASRHSLGATRLTPSGPCGYSCPRDQTETGSSGRCGIGLCYCQRPLFFRHLGHRIGGHTLAQLWFRWR